MKNKKLDRKILKWLLTGHTGTSSKAMAAIMSGIKCKGKRYSHPRDPADLNRCHKFLKAVPGASERLHMMSNVSPQWNILVSVWPELTELFERELRSRKDSRAPETYNFMRALLC